jgi:hypothetical protein
MTADAEEREKPRFSDQGRLLNQESCYIADGHRGDAHDPGHRNHGNGQQFRQKIITFFLRTKNHIERRRHGIKNHGRKPNQAQHTGPTQ